MLLFLDRDDLTAQSSAARITEPEVTAVDVGDWLKSLGLEQYAAAFRENGVNADILRHLTADDLKELGIAAVGHRRQLLIAINALRSKAGLAEPPAQVLPGPLTDPTGQPDASDTTAERRPLRARQGDKPTTVSYEKWLKRFRCGLHRGSHRAWRRHPAAAVCPAAFPVPPTS